MTIQTYLSPTWCDNRKLSLHPSASYSIWKYKLLSLWQEQTQSDVFSSSDFRTQLPTTFKILNKTDLRDYCCRLLDPPSTITSPQKERQKLRDIFEEAYEYCRNAPIEGVALSPSTPFLSLPIYLYLYLSLYTKELMKILTNFVKFRSHPTDPELVWVWLDSVEHDSRSLASYL